MKTFGVGGEMRAVHIWESIFEGCSLSSRNVRGRKRSYFGRCIVTKGCAEQGADNASLSSRPLPVEFAPPAEEDDNFFFGQRYVMTSEGIQ